jgi:four helix bundle protein
MRPGRKAKVESFEDLEVFQRAYRLSLEVHRTSLELPGIEQRALGDQIRRASKSICANVAEGYGRQNRSKAEFKRFLAMAIGSADEMRVWARYALDLGYLDEPAWRRWRDEYQTIARMLQSMVARAV